MGRRDARVKIEQVFCLPKLFPADGRRVSESGLGNEVPFTHCMFDQVPSGDGVTQRSFECHTLGRFWQ